MNSEEDPPVTRRIRFTKLHERIQSKYNEMQKRLEKSKSVDSLTFFDEDNVFMENMSRESEIDLTAEGVFQNERHSHPVMITATMENVSNQEVTYADEASVSECESIVTNSKEFQYGEDIISRLNSESLNELEKKSDDNTSLPPTPKLSIKNRIGSRISAARERRREEKGKKINKRTKDELEIPHKGEKFIFSNTNRSESRLNKTDKKIKLATVTIALIEVTGLETDTEEKQRYLQCRFKLGFEKWKSKTVKNVSNQSSVKWQEMFSMSVYEDRNPLEAMLFDDSRKDGFIGKSVVDISEMEKEKTHTVKAILEGTMPSAELFFLLTITGTPFGDLLVDLDDYMENRCKLERESENFVFYKLNDFKTVGRLSVIVYGAKGLAGSDCHCDLRLINEVRKTHTENKTNDPNWMKWFTFTVTDITSILEVRVVDDKKDEEVGRIAVPLLNINNGDKVWYALKDSTMRDRAKGNHPRILLEMRVSWNIIKASACAIQPKENIFLDPEVKFDRKLFLKNVARAKVVVLWVVDFFLLIKTCFEWESQKWNAIGLICWLLFIWCYRSWMLPLLLIVPFIWYRPEKYFFINWKKYILPSEPEHEETKEEKITLRQKLNNIQDLIQSGQNAIGYVASYGEKIKNLFNFSVPFLSFLAIFFLIAISLIIYIIPTQYILIAWSIKKYARKIIWPDTVGHIEVIDLLSRVPDDELLTDCENLPLAADSQVRQEEDQV